MGKATQHALYGLLRLFLGMIAAALVSHGLLTEEQAASFITENMEVLAGIILAGASIFLAWVANIRNGRKAELAERIVGGEIANDTARCNLTVTAAVRNHHAKTGEPY